MATNPTVTIKVDSTQAQNSIGAINEAVKNLGADFVKLDTQSKFDKLRKSLIEAKKTVEALESANVTATKEYQESLKAVTDLENAYAEFAKTSTDLNATFEDVAGEIQPLTARMGEMEDRLYELALAGQQNTQEFKDLTAEAGRYRQAMIQTDLAVDSAALTMTQKLGGALQGVVGAFAVAQGAMGLFGVESEATEKALLKVQSAMAVLQGFQAVKESLPALKALKNSIFGLVAPLLAQATATGTATASTQLLGVAMKALPILAIVGAITAVVVAFTSYNSKVKQAEEVEKKRKASVEATAKAQKQLTESVAKESTEFVGLIYQLKATNKSSKERSDLIKEVNNQYGTTLKNLRDEKSFQSQLNLAVTEYVALKEAQYRTELNEDKFRKVVDKKITAQNEYNKYQKENLDLLGKTKIANLEELEAFAQSAKVQNDYRTYGVFIGVMRSKLEAIEREDEKLQSLTVRHEDLAGRIDELTNGGKQYVEQTKETGKANEDLTKNTSELTNALIAYYDALESDRQGRITDAREKELQEAANRYDALTALADAANEDTKAITEQYQKDIGAINKKYNDLDEKENQDKLNNAKKLNAEILILDKELAMQQELNTAETEEEKIAIRKKYALSIANLQISQLEIERDIALQNTELTEQERQKIIADSELKIATLKGQFRDGNLKAEEKTVEEQKELNESLLQSYKGASNALIDAVNASFSGSFDAINEAFSTLGESILGEDGLFKKLKEGSITAMEAIAVGIETISGILSSVFDNQEEKALEASGERFEVSTEKYDELLANRLISQEQYDAKVKQLEDKKAEEEKQSRLKAFRQNKALAVINAVTSTASAIIAAFAAGAALGPAGVVVGPVMAGVAAALGAAQVAIISSQQFKAARGGIVPGSGPSTIDSVDAKLAPGETVINAQSSSMFPSLLSELNQLGGGVSLAPDPIQNMTAGSGTVFEPQGGALRAYVVEQDMTDSQRRVRRMENAGTFG